MRRNISTDNFHSSKGNCGTGFTWGHATDSVRISSGLNLILLILLSLCVCDGASHWSFLNEETGNICLRVVIYFLLLF